jgi:hypothetical protein
MKKEFEEFKEFKEMSNERKSHSWYLTFSERQMEARATARTP